MLLLLPILLTAGALTAIVRVSSEAELNVLNKHAVVLHQAGKSSEAIPLAKRYAAVMEVRHGESSPTYANAINNLAQFLTNANRLA